MQKWTPLALACFNGFLPVVQFLLSLPHASLHLPTPTAMTCLMIAVEQGYFECTLALLAHAKNKGEDVSLPSSNPLPLSLFISPLTLTHHSLLSPQLLLPQRLGDGRSLLHLAATRDERLTELLLREVGRCVALSFSLTLSLVLSQT